MKSRFLVITLCLFVTQFLLAQDEEFSVTLYVNQDSLVKKELRACMLNVQANDFGQGTEITVDIKNNQESTLIFLFDKAYQEKALKKMSPSILFDKSFSGKREVNSCTAIEDDGPMMIDNSSNRIITFKGVTGERTQCFLPLYIAEFKKKGFLKKAKYLIVEKENIKININIELEKKTDVNYERICKTCEDIIEEMRELRFCNSKTHSSSLEKQTEPYKTKIQNLKDEISDIKLKNSWSESAPEYQKYKELIEKLDAIEFKTQYCDKCATLPKKLHNCDYCKITPEDLFKKIKNLYIKLDNGEITAPAAKNEAKSLRKAWTGNCPNLKSKMNNYSNANIIESYYNSIMSK